MKLKNKISGEIKEFALFDGEELQGGATLESLTKDWEDVPEEPKDFWYIGDLMIICGTEGEFTTPDLASFTKKDIEKLKAIGNYFESKEEAEAAVEKLKAFKRLKDKGFRFTGYTHKDRGRLDELEIYCQLGECPEDIEDMEDVCLLFGGEE